MKKVLKDIARVIFACIIGSYCSIVYRVRTVGRENIPKEGNIVFCGNHKSYLDPLVIVLKSKRRIRFMAKEELKKNLLFKPILYLFDVIFVKRDSKDIGPLKEALKTLKEGGCIGIFPEGTRNGLEKNNGAMKEGAAYLALKTNSKILPIGIVGEAKPFHKNILYYGKPIDISEYQTKDKEKEKENLEKITNVIKEEIINLTTNKNWYIIMWLNSENIKD